jgi:hypothetical protein
MMQNYLVVVLLALSSWCFGQTPVLPTTKIVASSLFKPFLSAVDSITSPQHSKKLPAGASIFRKAMEKAGVSPAFLARRFARRNFLHESWYKYIHVEQWAKAQAPISRSANEKIAVHAAKFDVLEDYDDVSNDNIYLYFITTYGDFVWGRTTQTYKGLDEGDSFFFNADDRAIFGPKGAALALDSHLLIDVGIIESDGDDIAQLQKLSTVIINSAAEALMLASPQAGAIAAVLRSEVANLLKYIVSLDQDDRLVTDTIHLDPSQVTTQLGAKSFYEMSKRYQRKTFFTAFDYRLTLRVLKPI